jgi:hypothetical protein
MEEEKKEKEKFLECDLFDALKGLCVGAVTWQAHPEEKDHHYLRALGMYINFMQARALYEFFGDKPSKGHKNPLQKGSTAWAGDFTRNNWQEPTTPLYNRYMDNQKPALKRVFHLAYVRSEYSGGNERDEKQDLKNQVVNFAKDLIQLTEKFIKCIEPEFKDQAESALKRARDAAQELADDYKITNPLA